MKKIWIYGEIVKEQLSKATLELLTKARELAQDLDGKTELAVVLIGQGLRKHEKTLAEYGGDRLYIYEDENLEYYHPIKYADVLEDLILKEKPDILLFGASYYGSQLGPAVAARLEIGVAAHCIELYINEEELLVAHVPSFGGKIIGEILCPDTRPQMASVKEGIFPSKRLEQKESQLIVEEIRDKSKDLKDNLLKVIQVKEEEFEGIALEDAEVVLCGGLGLGSQDNWNKMEILAGKLGGTVCCTRPAMDEGWAKEHLMVGTSGRTIKPKVYIAFGVSGSTHHICGMQNSDLIISINNDKKAPIFNISNIGIVEDVEIVLDDLLKRFD